MFVEKKIIGNKSYYYLKTSERKGNKVKSKTIAYLGKAPMSKKEIQDKIDAQNKLKLLLDEAQIEHIEDIKKDFDKKLISKDTKLIEDMFRDFKTHYIYNTNAIEGNTLTLEETNMLLNKNITPEGKDLREIYDHINEKETFDFIMHEMLELSNENIIKLHKMLLNNIDKRIGSYRQHNVRVFGASFDTSPAEYVSIDMNLLLKWHKSNKDMHPLIAAAIFHERFERIHPFYDGNGRTGRMLSNLILIRKGYPPIIIENKKRKEYYEALSKAHEADINKQDYEDYKPIVTLFYEQLVNTYE